MMRRSEDNREVKKGRYFLKLGIAFHMAHFDTNSKKVFLFDIFENKVIL